ncbi:MAG: transcriptional regulator [Ramlibacter sp.]|nr:transcriptional regulator [Ramlibacter sp.]
MLLLRELAARGSLGWNLRDLATHCNLDRGTVRRILQCLVRERLALEHGTDQRYSIGPLSYELGASMPRYAEFNELARATVRKLARAIPRVVALAYLRSGDDCVCIARSGSSSYTREGTGIRLGHRTPMLSLVGGVSILAALPPAQAQDVVARNRLQLAHLGAAHLARSEALVRARDRSGCVVSGGVVWHGVHALSVAFRKGADAVGSLALGGSEDDYPGDTIREAAKELTAAASSLGQAAGELLA